MRDPIEHLLQGLSEKCTTAWTGKGSECSACPVAEVAALVAAALTFYRENHGKNHKLERLKQYDPEDAQHWSDTWKRR